MPKKRKRFFENKALMVITAVVVLEVLFIGVYFLTTFICEKTTGESETASASVQNEISSESATASQTQADTSAVQASTDTNKDSTTTTTTAPETSKYSSSSAVPGAQVVSYPSDDASWQMICLNRYRCIDASVEKEISLSYVAGSSIRMDSRAAAAYDKMYSAAAADGIYLTPCSGYRSYSTQKTLYYEFVNEYLNSGYSESEAHDLASRRRNPPGSSEHNIGICMDIICASSSANFQNTKAYAWLTANAQDYGFILRYPEDKVDITGVKFEPWHWRYVGVENAKAIKASGLCLEEYLGLA